MYSDGSSNYVQNSSLQTRPTIFECKNNLFTQRFTKIIPSHYITAIQHVYRRTILTHAISFFCGIHCFVCLTDCLSLLCAKNSSRQRIDSLQIPSFIVHKRFTSFHIYKFFSSLWLQSHAALHKFVPDLVTLSNGTIIHNKIVVFFMQEWDNGHKPIKDGMRSKNFIETKLWGLLKVR